MMASERVWRGVVVERPMHLTRMREKHGVRDRCLGQMHHFEVMEIDYTCCMIEVVFVLQVVSLTFVMDGLPRRLQASPLCRLESGLKRQEQGGRKVQWLP